MSEEQYEAYRHQTLWELWSQNPLWEIFGDAGNWFPYTDEDTRAAYAARILHELRDERWVTFVYRPDPNAGDEHDAPLTDDQFEGLFESGLWRSRPPIPDEAQHIILVPTQKAHDWHDRLSRRRVRGLDHCVIAVTDWDRSNAFYRDVLGAELLEIDKGRNAYRFGEQQLNVHGPGSEPHPRAADPVRPGNSDLCFVWDGRIDEAVDHLRSKGVEVELGPVERIGAGGTGTSVYFRDPDGSLLELISYS